jgi:hypothetical protein
MGMAQDSIKILLLADKDTLVFQKNPKSRVFISTTDSVIMGKQTFITLVNYLVSEKVIHPNVLEGILEEYYTE